MAVPPILATIPLDPQNRIQLHNPVELPQPVQVLECGAAVPAVCLRVRMWKFRLDKLYDRPVLQVQEIFDADPDLRSAPPCLR